MILNLFPVPPLDGSRVLTALLPPVLAYKYNQLERYGLLIIMLLLMTGYLGRILEPILTGFLSLVGLIFGL
jgi:Zn-dependent protease